MADHGLLLLRIALGIVFLWFGVLKLIPDASPAEALAGQTIERLTFVAAAIVLGATVRGGELTAEPPRRR